MNVEAAAPFFNFVYALIQLWIIGCIGGGLAFLAVQAYRKFKR